MKIERQICMDLPSYQIRIGQKINFPLPIIEQSDLDNVQSFCDGFCHSGKIGRLEDILAGGILSCSKRHSQSRQQRDRNTDKPNNAGIYFRFVRHSPADSANYSDRLDNCVIDALSGVGTDAGAVYFMGLNYALHREITTTSSLDTKYGFNDAASAANVFRDAAQYAYSHRGNNAEIAFFWEVELSAVSAIYCMTDRLTDSIREKLLQNNFMESRSFFRNLTGIANGGTELQWTKYVNGALSPPNMARAASKSKPGKLFHLTTYRDPTQPMPSIRTTQKRKATITKPQVNQGRKNTRYLTLRRP